MAWTFRVGLFQRLDDEFKSDVNLSDALNMPQLIQALNEQSPRVVKYIIKHIKEIIEISIGRTTLTDEENKKQCINILTKSPVIREYFCKDQDLFTYLIDSFSDDKYDYLPTINLLQGVIDISSGTCLKIIKDSPKFLKTLLNLLPSPSIYTFLLDLFSHTYKSVVKWSVEIESDKLLYPFLQEEEPKMVCALSILNKLVNIFPSKSEPMKRIASKSILSQIFSAGIDAPTNEAAYAAFRLIVTICNNCDVNDQLGDVIEFLESKSIQISRYIVNGRQFTKDKCTLCELFNAVISANSTVSPQILETVSYLFDAFFKNKTNSFLHLTFFDIFENLFKTDQNSFSQFIDSQKVVDRLLEFEEKRETELLASFWGFLTKMEIILKETVKDNDRWSSFVSEKLTPRESIIEKNYGGEVPKVKIIMSDSEELFGLDKLEKFQNSSSDSSEDEEKDEDDDDELVSASDEEEEIDEKNVFIFKKSKNSQSSSESDKEDAENIDHDDKDDAKKVEGENMDNGENIDHDDKSDSKNDEGEDVDNGENIDHDGEMDGKNKVGGEKNDDEKIESVENN